MPVRGAVKAVGGGGKPDAPHASESLEELHIHAVWAFIDKVRFIHYHIVEVLKFFGLLVHTAYRGEGGFADALLPTAGGVDGAEDEAVGYQLLKVLLEDLFLGLEDKYVSV